MAIDIPLYGKLSFNCPHCKVHAKMHWVTLNVNPHISMATCQICQESSIWHTDQMIYPEVGIAPPPHRMMPVCVLEYYNIARALSRNLPAVSSSFLRLAIRDLFILLGESGSDFGEDIESLLKRRFADRNFWKPMLTARLTGFDIIKPGIIDQRDNFIIMELLFNFINSIITEVITNPSHLAEFYAKLSDPSKENIKNIDPNFFQRS